MAEAEIELEGEQDQNNNNNQNEESIWSSWFDNLTYLDIVKDIGHITKFYVIISMTLEL